MTPETDLQRANPDARYVCEARKIKRFGGLRFQAVSGSPHRTRQRLRTA